MVLWNLTLSSYFSRGTAIDGTLHWHNVLLFATTLTFLGSLISVKLEKMEIHLAEKAKAEVERAVERGDKSYQPSPWRDAIIQFSDLLQASGGGW